MTPCHLLSCVSLALLAANSAFAAHGDVKPLTSAPLSSTTASQALAGFDDDNVVPYPRDLLAPTNLAYGPQATHYQIEIDVGTRAEVKLFFKEIRLPQGARLEVSRADGSQMRVYGWVDFQGGTGFSPFSLDAERVRVRIVYPSNVARTHGDTVALSHYTKRTVVSTKTIFGQDEREHAYCLRDRETDMYRRSLAVANIATADGWRFGTAWLYGNDNHVITNNHVVSANESLRNTELNLMYQKHFDCGWTSAEEAIVYSRNALDDVVVMRPGHIVTTGGHDVPEPGFVNGAGEKDYTVYTINDFDYRNAKIKQLFGGLAIDPIKTYVGEPLYLPQHGDGNEKTIAHQDSGKICTVTNLPGGLVRTRCDITGGSSGSPLISRTTHWVIGLLATESSVGNGGPTSFELWGRIKDHVPKSSNVEVLGEGHVVGGAINVFGSSGGTLLKVLPSGLSFEELSGTLVHRSNDSRLTIEAEDIDHGGVSDLAFLIQLVTPCGTRVALNQATSCSMAGVSILFIALDVLPHTPWDRRMWRGWIGLTTKRADGSLAYNLMVNVTASQWPRH